VLIAYHHHIMLFCSDPQMDTCSSGQSDIIFPGNFGNKMFLLDPIIVPTNKVTPCHQTTLPPSGTPLSIFQFAGLSSEQQKQWLEACGDMKSNNNSKTTQRKARAKVLVQPLPGNDAGGEQSCKSDETDSITSFTSSRSGDQQCQIGVQKRSIFAPYWAKTVERPAQQNDHDQDTSTPVKTAKRTVVEILSEASQKSMIIPPLHTSTTMSDRCAGDNSLRPRLHQDETRIATLLEQPPPPPLMSQRRAVSTSAISSILKKKEEEGGGRDGDVQQQEQGEGGRRRRRSSSFSVSFDSKVNVVLVFQDKPPYQTRRIPPWWARGWLSGMGSTTGEVDITKAIENLAVTS
jgi:hypothetical protein